MYPLICWDVTGQTAQHYFYHLKEQIVVICRRVICLLARARTHTQFHTNMCALAELQEKQLLWHHRTIALMGFMYGDRRERFGANNWVDRKYPCLCCSPWTPYTHKFSACLSTKEEPLLTSIAEKWVYIISVQRPRSNSHSGRAPAQRSKLPREISAAFSMSFCIIVCSICLLLLFCLLFYCFCSLQYLLGLFRWHRSVLIQSSNRLSKADRLGVPADYGCLPVL